MKARNRNAWLLAGLFLFLVVCFSARANVYATDIQVNGSLQAGVFVPGAPVIISYILNDTATNVSLSIHAGTNVVKTFTSDDGGAGTNTGLNTIVWDGTNSNGAAAAEGVYYISITASAAGYDTWTNITDDGANFDLFLPTSIAVNKNTNSPYYGRVFVGNGETGQLDDGEVATNGIFKYNADGSAADEGGFGTGGYSWGNGGYSNPSPWKMDVGSDDRLYVDDWSENGLVMSFDQVLSTNYLDVLRIDNYPNSDVNLSGPCVRGSGTNMQIFMADFTPTNLGGLGILSWTLNSNGVINTFDTGMVDVALTNNADLTLPPYAVSVDTNGDIFTVPQEYGSKMASNDPNARVLGFPPDAIGAPPDTNALWEIGGGDPWLVNNSGIAVDPTATYVAVATRGFDNGNGADSLQDGGMSIYLAANGDLVTNITQDAEGDTNLEYFDVAWDKAGNLYTVYGADGLAVEGWRVYSPPGPNQATTVAVPFIQVYTNLAQPKLGAPTVCMGQLNFTLMGQSNVTYVVQQSCDLINWTNQPPVATNYSPNSIRPISISISPNHTRDFYRAVAIP